jgi:uncharacterized membrane protein YbhN (UPF0104 family)
MMPAQVPTSRHGVASATLRLAIAAAILVYLFRSVPASRVGAVLGRADLAWVAAALGLGLLTQALVAMRLRVFTNAYALSLTTFDVFEINLATRFYGLFLPGGGAAATAVRVVKLARLKKDHAGAIASIGLDRVVATLAMCCVGLAFGLVAARPGQSAWLLLMGIAVLGLAAPFGWLLGPWSRSGAFAKRLGVGDRFQPIRRIADAMLRIPRNDWARILGWSLLAQLLGTLEYLALARSLGLELGFAALGWIRAVMLLAALAPITISGLGLREGAAVLVLPAYGVGPDAALAFSLLVFAVGHLALGLAGGLLEALALRPRGRVRTP